MFLVAISALGQFCLPRLSKERKHTVEHRSLLTSEVNVMHDFLDTTKVWCLSFFILLIILIYLCKIRMLFQYG